jgi:hypothetical protein
MKKYVMYLGLAVLVLAAAGCAPMLVGGAVAVSGSGTYFYINGELKTDYYASFDKVWSACEQTLADMRAIDVEPKKEIGYGSIAATINDEKVQFKVEYKAKNATTVSIRVGLLGDKLASQLLHDKVSDYLAK